MSAAVHLEILYRAADGVGESLQWIAEEKALCWVDITGHAIKRLEPGSRRFDRWTTPGMPAAIVPRQAGGAVVAIGRRLAGFDYGDRYETLLTPEPDLPGNRLNEAAADPLGRLWVGTMENNVAPDGSPSPISGRKGSLYVVDGSGTCRRASEHLYGITNTLVWRDRTFITADTLAGELYAFDYDPDTGAIADRRLYCGEPGHPDGSCLDRTATCGTPGSATAACCASTRTGGSTGSCRCPSATPPPAASAASGSPPCSSPRRVTGSTPPTSPTTRTKAP